MTKIELHVSKRRNMSLKATVEKNQSQKGNPKHLPFFS